MPEPTKDPSRRSHEIILRVYGDFKARCVRAARASNRKLTDWCVETLRAAADKTLRPPPP